MKINNKIQVIRKTETLTQEQMCDVTGLKLGTLRGVERKNSEQKPSSDFLMAITTSETFKKYTLWLMTDDVCPECGQVSPEIAQELYILRKKELDIPISSSSNKDIDMSLEDIVRLYKKSPTNILEDQSSQSEIKMSDDDLQAINKMKEQIEEILSRATTS